MDLSVLPAWLQQYDSKLIIAAAVAIGFLLLVLLIRLFNRGGRVPASRALVIQSFQIAPLGRDAFLKILNPGSAVTLSGFNIEGRSDVVVKNVVAGQQLPKTGTYSVLLEAAAGQRLSANFTIQLTFVDEQRKSYEQAFRLSPIASVSLKRKR